MSTTQQDPLPREQGTEDIVKQVHVRVGTAVAFRALVDEIGAWWPLATHSVFRGEAASVVVEPRVGGRIVETSATGRTAVWGTVLRFEPPTLLETTWHPGTSEEEATLLRLELSPDDGGTTVRLRHTGWGRRPDGPDARTAYDAGWDLVLGRFASRATG